ncbi:MAG: hypothetical protein HW383_283 [Candidatus Magasanikbacteria bacterium]|nr:hypothetical protein [Candidatus Magasanikbacteria bacterium]
MSPLSSKIIFQGKLFTIKEEVSPRQDGRMVTYERALEMSLTGELEEELMALAIIRLHHQKTDASLM